MDRMRESVFAVLGDLTGLSFCDIFSGSGIIALEAASRGASFIEAVESDPLKRKILLSNAALSPVRINCRFMSAELYITHAKRNFDIVFLDPPFSYSYTKELLESLAVSKAVSNETSILIHHQCDDVQIKDVSRIIVADRRIYGRSVVDFLKIKSEN